jgi:SAM-dependent methyltransferase
MRNKTIAVLVTLFMLLAPYFAAPPAATAQEYQPSVGQEGKDVIWVPTPQELIEAMLDLAKVTPNDNVMDLGSGDGRIVIAAAKRGARATGVEFNPDMVELSTASAEKQGVAGKANFLNADIFETDFSQATVLTMYLLPSLNMKLRPKILEMKPGTRIVTHAFTMEDWEADQRVNVEERNAYLWIVPAKVAGTWTWETPSGNAELTLKQAFQKIEGSLRSGGRAMPLTNAKLEGALISFSVGQNPSGTRQYSGRVTGNAIDGTIKSADGSPSKWNASRKAAQ